MCLTIHWKILSVITHSQVCLISENKVKIKLEIEIDTENEQDLNTIEEVIEKLKELAEMMR